MLEKVESEQMTNNQEQLREKVLKLIKDNEQKVGAFAKNYRRWDSGLLITSIIVGTLATVLAGGAAVGGAATVNKLFGSWQVVCGIVAVFAAIATICGTIHKTLQINTRVNHAIECNAKLQSLELSLIIENKNPAEVAESYRQTLEKYPECLT